MTRPPFSRCRRFLGAALLLAAACTPAGEPPEGGGEQPATGESPLATSPEDEAADEEAGTRLFARLGDFRKPISPGTADGFAHDPHGRIACSACHADPPGHGTHRTVECVACHEAPGGPAADIPSPAECMGCHHAESRARACTRCHEGPSGLPEVGVAQRIDVAGTRDDRVRDLLFRHDVHSDVACTTCHRTSETFGVDRDCASCHDRHHRPDAECLSCHAPLPLDAHGREAHEGCAGAACHADPTVVSLPHTRSVCLACHQELTDHEPGGDCGGCHQLADGKPSPAPESRHPLLGIDRP